MTTHTTDQYCPDFCERKEVVVIGKSIVILFIDIHAANQIILGNGPSAIVLSYILSGHIPYWNGCPVSNDYLNLKLEQHVKDTSLLEQVSLIRGTS